MKIRFLTIKISTIAILSAYLFSNAAFASISKDTQKAAEAESQQSQLLSEIGQSLADLLADIGVSDVTPQAHKLLKHSIAEDRASASLKQSTDQLPDYKFKVVITE
ncbi:MAG: hypothetical protein NWQ54_18480 [Paraglaciecola sp.]|uniref:hypothetical protein n=1 Tax=Pseudomonadati TaxID=3379134 RepID=UPI00273F48D6|nr:hypothetical protein [Paraglaciecola sp.]MDP5031248.1 hypothetical protein [Paraglaciecola sp.]MDP5040911.1 hypothetical protein [Paraglaciecola sp.]MDP5132868.1 hypothetical protein [Paraglaciecola sp.]